MPTISTANTSIAIVSPLEIGKQCFIFFSHIERITILNGTDLFLQDEHFVRYSERWMLYDTNLLASLPEASVMLNASETDRRAGGDWCTARRHR